MKFDGTIFHWTCCSGVNWMFLLQSRVVFKLKFKNTLNNARTIVSGHYVPILGSPAVSQVLTVGEQCGVWVKHQGNLKRSMLVYWRSDKQCIFWYSPFKLDVMVVLGLGSSFIITQTSDSHRTCSHSSFYYSMSCSCPYSWPFHGDLISTFPFDIAIATIDKLSASNTQRNLNSTELSTTVSSQARRLLSF